MDTIMAIKAALVPVNIKRENPINIVENNIMFINLFLPGIKKPVNSIANSCEIIVARRFIEVSSEIDKRCMPKSIIFELNQKENKSIVTIEDTINIHDRL